MKVFRSHAGRSLVAVLLLPVVRRRHAVLAGLLALGTACGDPKPEAVVRAATDATTDSTTDSTAETTAPATVATYGSARPVDHAEQDPSFLAFRDSLLGIAARRDTLSLYTLLTPDVKASHGGDEGLDGFRAVFRPAEADTELWSILTDILRHGGRFAGPDSFIAPWTSAVPFDSIEALEHSVVRDSNVAVFAAPDSTSPVIARVSYAIVSATPYDAGDAWQMLSLTNGEAGYLRSRHVRSPAGWRIYFERLDGRWRITMFLQGD